MFLSFSVSLTPPWPDRLKPGMSTIVVGRPEMFLEEIFWTWLVSDGVRMVVSPERLEMNWVPKFNIGKLGTMLILQNICLTQE